MLVGVHVAGGDLADLDLVVAVVDHGRFRVVEVFPVRHFDLVSAGFEALGNVGCGRSKDTGLFQHDQFGRLVFSHVWREHARKPRCL